MAVLPWRRRWVRPPLRHELVSKALVAPFPTVCTSAGKHAVTTCKKTLESISAGRDSTWLFEDNLKKQEGNITEEGEGNATEQRRRGLEELKKEPTNPLIYSMIRQSLIRIQEVNLGADQSAFQCRPVFPFHKKAS